MYFIFDRTSDFHVTLLLVKRRLLFDGVFRKTNFSELIWAYIFRSPRLLKVVCSFTMVFQISFIKIINNMRRGSVICCDHFAFVNMYDITKTSVTDSRDVSINKKWKQVVITVIYCHYHFDFLHFPVKEFLNGKYSATFVYCVMWLLRRRKDAFSYFLILCLLFGLILTAINLHQLTEERERTTQEELKREKFVAWIYADQVRIFCLFCLPTIFFQCSSYLLNADWNWLFGSCNWHHASNRVRI